MGILRCTKYGAWLEAPLRWHGPTWGMPRIVVLIYQHPGLAILAYIMNVIGSAAFSRYNRHTVV